MILVFLQTIQKEVAIALRLLMVMLMQQTLVVFVWIISQIRNPILMMKENDIVKIVFMRISHIAIIANPLSLMIKQCILIMWEVVAQVASIGITYIATIVMNIPQTRKALMKLWMGNISVITVLKIIFTCALTVTSMKNLDI
jgi:hypothetical protein